MSVREKIYIPFMNQIVGGALGVSILILFAALTLEVRDIELKIALICVGIGIPFLCGRVFILILEGAKVNIKIDDPIVLAIYFIGVLTTYAGVSCIFFHLSWVYGIVFAIASITSLVLTTMTIERKVEEAKADMEKGSSQPTQ